VRGYPFLTGNVTRTIAVIFSREESVASSQNNEVFLESTVAASCTFSCCLEEILDVLTSPQRRRGENVVAFSNQAVPSSLETISSERMRTRSTDAWLVVTDIACDAGPRSPEWIISQERVVDRIQLPDCQVGMHV
jgi:hypothetical protein